MQPLCGIYHKSLYPAFKEMLKTDIHKLGYLLKNAKTHYTQFEHTKSFLNCNNKEEYRAALKLFLK